MTQDDYENEILRFLKIMSITIPNLAFMVSQSKNNELKILFTESFLNWLTAVTLSLCEKQDIDSIKEKYITIINETMTAERWQDAENYARDSVLIEKALRMAKINPKDLTKDNA